VNRRHQITTRWYSEASVALVGALVLVDQAPGQCWSEAVPWIPGGLTLAADPREPATLETDNTISIAPQRVDGRLIDLVKWEKRP
jgi:hypothetical protein